MQMSVTGCSVNPSSLLVASSVGVTWDLQSTVRMSVPGARGKDSKGRELLPRPPVTTLSSFISDSLPGPLKYLSSSLPTGL